MVLIAFVVLIMLSVLPPVHTDIAILHHIRRTLYVKDIPTAITAACLWVIKVFGFFFECYFDIDLRLRGPQFVVH